MFFLYQTALSILLLVSPIIIFFRIIKNKEDKSRYKEKFSVASKKRFKGNLIWFHGASVGEILSITPLIEYYEKDKSVDQILITSSTLSSSKVLNQFKFKKTVHQFYPIDHIFFISKFLNHWKPNVAIFIESEIWPYMFKELKLKNIPIILLNGRITKKTFNRWMKFRNFAQKIFNKIEIAYPQNLETKFYLKKLKTSKIKTLGNLKFSEDNNKKDNSISNKLKLELKKKKIWTASSTHADEEIFCANTHIELRKKITNLVTIIIPRHIHRVNKIIHQLKNLNLKVITHSSVNKKLKDVDIYLVDTFGETKKFHKISSSVFLGGSIAKRGGQNPLEAARYGARVLHGPNIDNFKDVYKTLSSLNASKKITSPKELSSFIIFKKQKNIGYKIKNIGANILKATTNELNKIIKNEFKKT
ncbi:3-deoxy-D-manno-octulosonic acid transferase [Candidatus Pelagibacter sp.]|nr:3-deoxy-D-manno-octulosonic acid transferase [Candidatus Pelagibacter sp.]